MSGSKTYQIKTGGPPSGDPGKYDYGLIQSLLEATSHEKVSAAGAAYNDAARIVGMVAHELYLVGTKLSEKWEGADADAAQKALGQLYATANELFGRSQQAGAALQTYGAALSQFKGLQWPNWPTGGASPVEDEKRQQVAEKVMQAVNQRIAAAWESMPDKVQQNLPYLDHHWGTPYSPDAGSPNVSSGAGGAGGGGGAGGPSGRVHLPHVPQSPGMPHVPQGNEGGLPTSPDGGHGADLASMPSMDGGSGPLPGGSLPSSLSGGTSSLPGGGLTPSGVGGPSLYPAPGSLPGGGPGLSGGPGSPRSSLDEAAASRAAAAGEAEASQEARNGLPGAPGAPGGAAGSGDVERERGTWLAEEEATWGAEEDAIGNALGMPPGGGPAGEADAERERTTWLGEDREVWTGEEAWPNGMIGETPSTRAEADTGDAPVEVDEVDILDPERLQALLDVIITPGEEGGTGASTAGAVRSPGLLDDLTTEEVNDIDRLLNG